MAFEAFSQSNVTETLISVTTEENLTSQLQFPSLRAAACARHLKAAPMTIIAFSFQHPHTTQYSRRRCYSVCV